MVTTPSALTCTLLDFCREIAPDSTPVYLPVRPYRTAQPLECFDNVDRIVRLSGGEPIHGWLIWTWPGAFLEAEHHCVLRCNDGRLRDVTPQEEDRVLFLPDPEATVEDGAFGRPNIRKAIAPDTVIADYLAAFERIDQFRSANLRPGLNVLSPELRTRYNALESESLRLALELMKRTTRRGFQSRCA